MKKRRKHLGIRGDWMQSSKVKKACGGSKWKAKGFKTFMSCAAANKKAPKITVAMKKKAKAAGASRAEMVALVEKYGNRAGQILDSESWETKADTAMREHDDGQSYVIPGRGGGKMTADEERALQNSMGRYRGWTRYHGFGRKHRRK